MSQVSHDGKETGAVERKGEVEDVGVGIAKTVPRPPVFHVVVAPDEGEDNGKEVPDLDGQDEDRSSKLPILI